MSAVTCAHHPDRTALSYCAGCGKALCADCVVRLSVGNYCESCAETPDHRPRAARRRASRLWLWAVLAALAMAIYLVVRAL
ncbi:MAG: B-box zinc finger protein [Armatimonadota bacterium]|nr:B-box zinc finger protein [Armatimonadota bacterium]